MKDPTPAQILESTFRDKSALVGMVGLGYVGLPLALAFVENGFRVLGFDKDPART
jgi:UDP-N-acetyl-D-glucosamine dehydrogenase